ncbi:MAG TPA: carbon-nitrogen hydrolase family protein [Devosia sp.]|nr:carbon-nitrogen hydrolase family protein [Devosia sp.]
MTKFVAAAVQMCSGRDVDRNLTELERLVRQAASAGASYVQTPELTGGVRSEDDLSSENYAREEDDPVAAAASRLAAELGIVIHIGSTVVRRGDGKLANRALVYRPNGRLAARYDKIHMFDVDLDTAGTWRESSAFEPGSEAVVADLGPATFGLAICYDLRFPQLFRAEALAGAEVLTAPAAFTRQTGEAHWHVLVRSRAIENGAFLVAAAQGGRHEDGRETFGHTMIVDPWGRVVAEVSGTAVGIAIAEIDTSLSAHARFRIPNLRNDRPFMVVGPKTKQALRDTSPLLEG